jgi:hypothetical protein
MDILYVTLYKKQNSLKLYSIKKCQKHTLKNGRARGNARAFNYISSLGSILRDRMVRER